MQLVRTTARALCSCHPRGHPKAQRARLVWAGSLQRSVVQIHPHTRVHAHMRTLIQIAHTQACTYTHVPMPTCAHSFHSLTDCTHTSVHIHTRARAHACPQATHMHVSCMPDLVGLCPVTWNTLSLLPWTLPVSRGGEPVSSQRSVAAPLAAGQAGAHQLCLKCLTAPRSTLV